MIIGSNHIESHNEGLLKKHQNKLVFTASEIDNTEAIIQKLIDFQIAIPSWALGTGGTRFGRFAGGGEPRSIEEKIEDVGLLHKLNSASGAISLHIPWDIPQDYKAIKALAAQHDLKFDAMKHLIVINIQEPKLLLSHHNHLRHYRQLEFLLRLNQQLK